MKIFNNICRLAFLSFFLIVLSNIEISAALHKINGKVTDITGKSPLIGASVKIEGAQIGAIADKTGSFTINKLRPGAYSLIVSMIGYESQKLSFNLPDDETKQIEIKLAEKAFKTAGIVITAGKKLQTVQETPISISIIDSRSLAQRSITKLDEALRSVPGVEMNKDNINIRGSSGFSFGVGSRALVLMDGYPILSGDNGDFKADAIPMLFVDQIEVVKAAGSALYGAGALGGVVNILTKEAGEEYDLRASSTVGFYTEPRYDKWKFTENTQLFKSVDAGVSKKFGNLGILVNGNYIKDDGYRAYDDSKRWNLFSKIQYGGSGSTEFKLTTDIASENRLDWIYWNSLDSATRPPTGSNVTNRIVSDKFFTFAEMKTILTDDHFLNVKAGYFRTELENSLAKTDIDYRQSIAETYNAEIQMNSKLNSKFFLTYGVNFQHSKVDAVIYGNHTQNVLSAYAQGEYTIIDSLKATAGARYDYEKTANIERDMKLSPKLAFSYLLPNSLSLRLSAGSGFRAPAVAERYAAAAFQGFKVKPNTALKSERSISIEAGASKEFTFLNSPCYVDMAVFQNELYDMIEPAFTGTDGSLQFINTIRARVTGIDFLFRTALFNFLGFETNLTFMNPIDINLDKTLKYRSKFFGGIKLMAPLGPVELQGEFRYKSRIQEIDAMLAQGIKDGDARVEMKILDLRAIFNLNSIGLPGFKASINAKNVLDYYFTEVPGNLYPTRNFSLRIDYAGF